MNNQRAFALLELAVVLAICAIGFLLFMPAQHGKQSATRIQCVNNLKRVGLAFRVWSDDHGAFYPTQYRTNNFDGPSYANEKQMFLYFQVMSNELHDPKFLICPTDKKRKAATNFVTDFDSSHLSFFVGLNADQSEPNSLLGGDRNLTGGDPLKGGVLELATNQITLTNYAIGWTKANHKQAGNTLFADGHVEQLSSSKVREAITRSGLATNRFVFPP